MSEYTSEYEIYRDAWRIADPGAVNAAAVANSLAKGSHFLVHRIGSEGVRNHPALKVMAAQLAMLFDVTKFGADVEVYDQVKLVVDRGTVEEKVMSTRTAEIIRNSIGGPTAEVVAKYLPSNYRVSEVSDDKIVITGEDDHGWTLDDYVIPRLASGLIYARELKEN